MTKLTKVEKDRLLELLEVERERLLNRSVAYSSIETIIKLIIKVKAL